VQTTEGGRQRKNTTEGEEKKKRLVGLIAGIVDRSIAHPADLAELLTLFSSENFKGGSIGIDKSVVVFVLITGNVRVWVKRSTI
jgi:hypothetical protein